MQKKIIIVLILIIVLLISGGVTYFVLASKAGQPEVYMYDPGDFFVTNVSDSKCLVKADILIELSDKDTNEYLTDNSFKVRDAVVRILRGKTYNDIMRADIQDEIKKDIIDKLTSEYELDGIENVYFNEFVVQQ